MTTTALNNEPWFALGFGPDEIGLWRSIEFTPDKVTDAIQAERAATWREADYTADEARAWVSAEDAPHVGFAATYRFRSMGWHPGQVSALLRLLSREGYEAERENIETWADMAPEVALTCARGGFGQHDAHVLGVLPLEEVVSVARERFEGSAQIPLFAATQFNHHLALGGFYDVPDGERPWWARRLWDLHDEENAQSLRGGGEPGYVDRPGARPGHARAAALRERRRTEGWGIAADWLLPQPSGEPCPVEDFTDAAGNVDVDVTARRTRGEPVRQPESHVRDYLARRIPLIDPDELWRWPIAATTVVVIDGPVLCQLCGREPARYVLDVVSLGGEGLQALCPRDARPVTTYLGGEGIGHAAYLMLKGEVPRTVGNEVNLVLKASGREPHFPVRADGGWWA